MNPFDDMTPEEKSPENQEMLALLRRYSTHPAPSQNVSAEQARILAHARARLLQTNAAMSDEEMQQAPDSLILMPLPASTPQNDMRRRRSSHNVRILTTIAAAIVIVILLGSSLLFFAQYASHRAPIGKYTSTVVSTPMSATQPTAPVQSTGPCLLGPDMGLVYVCQHHLYQDFSLTKSIGDYTMTIKQAYADATRVVIFYTVYKGKTNVSSNIHAITSHTLEQNSSSNRGTDYSFKQGSISSFSVDPLSTANSSQLKVQFEVHYLISATSGMISTGTPVDFNLSIAYHPENSVSNIHQSAVANSITLTLLQTLVSVSEVRFSFSSDAQNLMLEGATLDANGTRCEPVSGGFNGGINTIEIGCPLFQKQGTWTFTVTGVVSPNGGPSSRQVGPWVFHVQAPS